MKRNPFCVSVARVARLSSLARPALARAGGRLAFVLGACAALGIFASPGSAVAGSVQYQLASVDLDFNDSGFGLQLFADTSVLDTSVFSLDDFQSRELAAFRVGTKEFDIDFDDKFAKPIKATFAFSMPGDAQATVFGKSEGVFKLFKGGIGVVEWGLPDIVFTPAAVFAVSLSDVKFGTPGKALVTAKIKQLKSKAPAPIPEPASVALFLIGGGIAGLAIRRGRRHTDR